MTPMNILDKSAVLFDFDGVIADTEMGILSYMEKVYARYGIRLTDEEKMSYIGTDGRELTKSILQRAGVNKSVEEFMEEKRQSGNFYEDSPDLKAMPGVKDFLQYLKAADLKIGLVSSTSTKLIITALNRLHLMGMQDVIICGDMVAHKKPSPECYLKAMAFLNVKPQECVIIEDSPTGIRAGKAAGSYVIAFKGGSILQDTSEADEEWMDYSYKIK